MTARSRLILTAGLDPEEESGNQPAAMPVQRGWSEQPNIEAQVKTHRYARKLLAGSAVVIWLGGISSIILSVIIAVETSLAIGAMAVVIGVILTASALALVQIARAMLEIAATTSLLTGRAEPALGAEEVETDEAEEAETDETEDLPKVVGRIEPRLQPQGRIEPPLFRSEGGAGGLRAVRG